VLDVVSMARNVRHESMLPPRAPVKVTLVTQDQTAFAALASHAALIAHLGVLKEIERATGKDVQLPRLSSIQSNGTVDVVVHLEGLVDVEKEKARLVREIEKAKKEKDGLEKRFANPDFVKRAAPEIIAEARANLAALEDKITRFTAAQQRLA
jgi:valyl-tRNA synthetase